MLRNTAQISFNELYMERSTRRSEFFKKVKHPVIDWEGIEKEIRKIYQKTKEQKVNLHTVEYRYLR
ncbi:MAG: hypothetical protein ACMUEL_04170 [Flavobacteriales bacterium Tduv]